MTKRLAVIDGKSVFYRGYYAMPSFTTKEGIPTGGVYGFAALGLELIRKLKPDYVAVAWDKPKTNIRKRKEIYPDYKAGRKKAPQDFYDQIPILHELLEAFGWPLYELDDYEADDIMGTFAVQAAEQGIHTSLITSDLDALQIIGPHTDFYAMKKGLTNIELFNPESFEAKYSLKVEQFLDLKALQGDSSDNIPGVPGIGPKTAIDLLKKYETLDGIYENLDEIKDALRRKLEAGKDSAYMSKEVGKIWCDAPVKLDLEAADVTDLDVQKLADLLRKLEFRSLLKNLPTHMQVGEESAAQATAMALQPAVIGPASDDTIAELLMVDKIVAMEHNDQYILSLQPESGYIVDTAEAKKILANAKTIAHDAKLLIKDIFGKNVPAGLIVEHDTKHAAFLLNSLERNLNPGDLLGLELNSEDSGQMVAAIWRLYQEQLKALTELPKLHSLATTIDFALIPLLARMEEYGVKIDTHFMADMSDELGARINELKAQIFEAVGYEFNIGSPAQLADVLFGKLQLPTTGIKKGKTGYSTGAKELDKLRGQHPIIEMVEEYRELTKLKSTYIDSLPKLVDDQSRLHTTFNQDVAATGRLSSTDPNLQNIPIRTEIGRKIRRAFIPEEGNAFVSADYSQFELRLAAVLAGDKQLIDDFNSDLDVHAKTASDVYGVPLEQVTKDQRRAAKTINFGVLYGMSPHGLSAATGMSFADAKKFIDGYFELRAPIRAYIDATMEKAKNDGYVETLFGRRRPTPDVRSSNFIVRQAAQRAAANMPIQGTEADLMKMAMLQVEEGLGDLGVQVLQIHDSILVECPRKNIEQVSDLLKRTMEQVYPKLGIKLRVDVSSGAHWGEL